MEVHKQQVAWSRISGFTLRPVAHNITRDWCTNIQENEGHLQIIIVQGMLVKMASTSLRGTHLLLWHIALRIIFNSCIFNIVNPL